MAYFDCIVGGASGDGSTLTVTCYGGFAGLTISITNGVDTFSDVCPNTSPYEVVFDGLADDTWTLSTTYNGDTYTKVITIISNTVFYPTPDGSTITPTDDIQIWLNCGNIFDLNYTALSQVLADTTTLLALISDNNAVDYMVRSTTWASDVCADLTAMTYIGANNYCANKLLANSTWRNAIANSTYFESVLNTKVPTLTSSSAEKSQVIVYAAVGQDNAEPYSVWHVFDNTSQTGGWKNNDKTGSGTQRAYLGYDFGEMVTPIKSQFKYGETDSPTWQLTLRVQGSNDMTTWDDLTPSQNVGMSTSFTDFISNVVGEYRYVIFEYIGWSGFSSTIGYPQAQEMQFYCRKDV